MIAGQTIVGDDLAYLRKKNRTIWTANVEAGIFGIIRDVKLRTILSSGMSSPIPARSSSATSSSPRTEPLLARRRPSRPTSRCQSQRRVDPRQDRPGWQGSPPRRPQCRYTLAIKDLANRDDRADDPAGVPVAGIIFGGRDSDTCVPSPNLSTGCTAWSPAAPRSRARPPRPRWVQKACASSTSCPRSTSSPSHRQVRRLLHAVRRRRAHPPRIFMVNYFLKGPDGNYLNGMTDKNVWLAWMERRVHDEVKAIRSPAGWIPLHADLEALFHQVLDKPYSVNSIASSSPSASPRTWPSSTASRRSTRPSASFPLVSSMCSRRSASASWLCRARRATTFRRTSFER